MTKWAPYINFSHEYPPVNYPILQVNHRIEYTTNFGSLSPVSGQKLSAKTTARISATCPTGTAFSLGLGQGLHFKENSRQLCSDTNCVSYQLYQDAAYSTVWGDTLHHNTVDKVSSDGQSQQVIVYGAIPSQEWPPSDKYTDTVVVTLFY
ncbi:spore coat U domain-containing protein [Providencia stuartii]|nr:spore coat U domain-containing protein [Providencia stuartii]